MKKLHNAVNRFAYEHPNFGLTGLMRYIVIGTVIVYFLLQFSNYSAISFLAFDWSRVLRGEIWRLVTFIFIPTDSQPLWLILSLYFSYFIGNLLEREWGTAKFNLYYLSGVVLTILAGIVSHYAFGYSGIYGTYYISMSLFLAFATLYPEMQVIFIIFPIKVKWLALLDGLLFAYDVLRCLMVLDLLGALLPVIAILNYLVFFWVDLMDLLGYQKTRVKHQTSHKTIQFKSAVYQQQKKEAQQGYRHKCSICGRTDVSHPDLEFRYCSRCAGYHCFCQDHIFNHDHYTE